MSIFSGLSSSSMNRTLTILICILFVIALAGFAFFYTPNTPGDTVPDPARGETAVR